MEIKHLDNDGKGKFFIEIDGKEVAEMTYVWAGIDRIIIDHTGVNESLKGQGAGKKMVEKAVEIAREKGIKIVPLCPFAHAVFKKTKEWQDVI